MTAKTRKTTPVAEPKPKTAEELRFSAFDLSCRAAAQLAGVIERKTQAFAESFAQDKEAFLKEFQLDPAYAIRAYSESLVISQKSWEFWSQYVTEPMNELAADAMPDDKVAVLNQAAFAWTRRLLNRGPWAPNSSNPQANIDGLRECSALAAVIDRAENIVEGHRFNSHEVDRLNALAEDLDVAKS